MVGGCVCASKNFQFRNFICIASELVVVDNLNIQNEKLINEWFCKGQLYKTPSRQLFGHLDLDTFFQKGSYWNKLVSCFFSTRFPFKCII